MYDKKRKTKIGTRLKVKSGNKATTVEQRTLRRARVFEMFVGGMTIREIAERLKHSNQKFMRVKQAAVYNDVHRVLEETRRSTVDLGSRYRELLALKAMNCEKAIADLLHHPKPHTRIRAVETMLKIQERLASLYGADAPQQLDVRDVRESIQIHYVDKTEIDQIQEA